MWLLKGMTPDHKTISEFRRENIRPMQKLFREFNRLCQSWEMIGGQVIGIDGTKVKASNNKKRNYSRKKLEERVRRLDEKIAGYLEGSEWADAEEAEARSPQGMVELLNRKELYERYLREMDELGVNEVSEVDPDARLMGNNRGGVEMSYNVQSAVDGKHHIIVAYDVSLNPADHGQLSNMVRKVKKLGYKRFKVLADKGYYNGADLRRVKRQRVTAIVPRQEASDPKDQPEAYHTDQFKYDPKTDSYTCPAGHILYAHSKKGSPRRKFFDKQACQNCQNRNDCGRDKRGYRTITRNEHADIYDEVDANFRRHNDLYKLRQQIVEHPFGTIKRAMQGSYFLLRTRRKVRAEVALLFLGYDLKRAVKVLGFQGIMDRLTAVLRAVLANIWREREKITRAPFCALSSRV